MLITKACRIQRRLRISIPYSKQIKTDVVRKLITIFRECFDDHPSLIKLLKSQILRICYSVSQNIARIISCISKDKLDKFHNNDYSLTCTLCNCPNMNYSKVKDNSGMATEEIYKASMTSKDIIAEYIGCKTPYLKFRLANYNRAFRNPSLKNSISLSKFILQLKAKNKKKYKIDEEVISEARAYNSDDSKCSLCALELTSS